MLSSKFTTHIWRLLNLTRWINPCEYVNCDDHFHCIYLIGLLYVYLYPI